MGLIDLPSYEELQLENNKLRFALKSSIEVTKEYEKTIRTMNKIGLKFGMKPFNLIPLPSFIKQVLEG